MASSRAWGPSLTRPLVGALGGFLETVGVAVDGDDLGVVHQAVHEGDDASGVTKHGMLPLFLIG